MEVTIALAPGFPGTEMPYSVSMPIIRCTLMVEGYPSWAGLELAPANCGARATDFPPFGADRGIGETGLCPGIRRPRGPIGNFPGRRRAGGREPRAAGPRAGAGRCGAARAGRPDVPIRRCGPVLQASYRYWPVLATVSIERPESAPFLPETRVRM
ncbi:hypothetical protein GCM10023224_04420 [Streptomonospora halophila]|uniref:Uncharacterized protein n=1 Tax=Streptomonospora halophila TaxID=427369 RepID=A0ABP9G5P6_9ACTN